jgi:hypothetical protein
MAEALRPEEHRAVSSCVCSVCFSRGAGGHYSTVIRAMVRMAVPTRRQRAGRIRNGRVLRNCRIGMAALRRVILFYFCAGLNTESG